MANIQEYNQYIETIEKELLNTLNSTGNPLSIFIRLKSFIDSGVVDKETGTQIVLPSLFWKLVVSRFLSDRLHDVIEEFCHNLRYHLIHRFLHRDEEIIELLILFFGKGIKNCCWDEKLYPELERLYHYYPCRLFKDLGEHILSTSISSNLKEKFLKILLENLQEEVEIHSSDRYEIVEKRAEKIEETARNKGVVLHRNRYYIENMYEASHYFKYYFDGWGSSWTSSVIEIFLHEKSNSLENLSLAVLQTASHLTKLSPKPILDHITDTIPQNKFSCLLELIVLSCFDNYYAFIKKMEDLHFCEYRIKELDPKKIEKINEKWKSQQDSLINLAILSVLAKVSYEESLGHLIKKASSDEDIRIIEILRLTGDKKCFSLFKSYKESPQPFIRKKACQYFSKLDSKEAYEEIKYFLRDENSKVRAVAVEGIGKYHLHARKETSFEYFDDRDWEVRHQVAKSLGYFSDNDVSYSLYLHYLDPNSEVKEACFNALVQQLNPCSRYYLLILLLEEKIITDEKFRFFSQMESLLPASTMWFREIKEHVHFSEIDKVRDKLDQIQKKAGILLLEYLKKVTYPKTQKVLMLLGKFKHDRLVDILDYCDTCESCYYKETYINTLCILSTNNPDELAQYLQKEFKKQEELAWIIICSLEQLSYDWPEQYSNKAVEYLAKLIIKDGFHEKEKAFQMIGKLGKKEHIALLLHQYDEDKIRHYNEQLISTLSTLSKNKPEELAQYLQKEHEFKRQEEVAWIIICSLEQLSYNWPEQYSNKAVEYLAKLIIKDGFYEKLKFTNKPFKIS